MTIKAEKHSAPPSFMTVERCYAWRKQLLCRSGRGGGCSDRLLRCGGQHLHKAAAALMLLQWEVLPLGLDLLVGLQHGAGLRLLHADLEAAVHDLADDDGVDALFLEVGTHGDQQQIDGVVAVEGLQHIRPAGGEQAAVVLFQGGGDAGGRHAEGHHLVFLVHNEAGELWVDQRGELPGIALDLCLGQLHRVGARVNGKLVNIDYKIQNGDRIEILTSQNSKGPSRDWLNIVKSTQAKSKINSWFKKEYKEDNIIRGKDLISAYCKSKGINLPDIIKPKYQQIVQKKYGFRDWDAVLAAIGHGGLKEGQVVNRLLEEYEKEHKKEITDENILEKISEANKQRVHIAKSKSGIVVKGINDMAVRFSKCCNPVPGDEIVGFVTRGRGMSIHRTDCINIINLSDVERSRLITAEWEDNDLEEGGQYLAELKIFADDRRGLLLDVSKVFTEEKIDVKSMNTRTSKKGTATMEMGFVVHGREELNRVIGKLRQIENVIDIERTTG